MPKKVNMTLKEAFANYARREKEFIENSDPEKVYHRIIPNIKDKNRGSINFLYKKIVVIGVIIEDTVYLEKYRTHGDEADLPEAIAKIEEVIKSGDMKLVNKLEV